MGTVIVELEISQELLTIVFFAVVPPTTRF